MRINQLRARLQQGQHVFGTMIQEVSSPFIVHVMKNPGFDFVLVDMEHGKFDLESTGDLLQMIRLTDMTCLVRASDNQYPLMARVLDAGAEGVMVPRISSRQDVEAVIRSVRYPPLGLRGLAVTRGQNDYNRIDGPTFVQHANRENLVIIQIERKEALDNIDDVLSVPGVDVALIGPVDLATSLDIPLNFDHPKMHEAIQKVIDACQRHHVYTGMHAASLEALSYWGKRGILMLSSQSDLDILVDQSKALCKSLRNCIQS